MQEVTSSQAMEKEAFIRCVTDIQENLLVPIRVISTDRHASIKKLMRTDPRFTNILHQFDAWHIGKGLIKKLLKASKKKGLRYLKISAKYTAPFSNKTICFNHAGLIFM